MTRQPPQTDGKAVGEKLADAKRAIGRQVHRVRMAACALCNALAVYLRDFLAKAGSESIALWAAAVVGAIAVIASTLDAEKTRGELKTQAKAMQDQLELMQDDERPWLQLKIGNVSYREVPGGTAVLVNLTQVNTGKTIAKNSKARLVVEALKSTDAPSYNYRYPAPVGGYGIGVLFPNSPFSWDQPVEVMKGPRDLEQRAFSKEELADLTHGRSYIVVYGILNYENQHGRLLWTQFCGFGYVTPAADAQPTNAPAQECGSFNQVDTQ